LMVLFRSSLGFTVVSALKNERRGNNGKHTGFSPIKEKTLN